MNKRAVYILSLFFLLGCSLPDLVINSVQPSQFIMNSPQNITVTVENRGGPASSIVVQVFLPDTPYKKEQLITLVSGEKKELVFDMSDFWMSPVQSFLLVRVDPENKIMEANENNNEKQIPIYHTIP